MRREAGQDEATMAGFPEGGSFYQARHPIDLNRMIEADFLSSSFYM